MGLFGLRKMKNGSAKLEPISGGGGGGGIKTAILKQDGYDDVLAGVSATASASGATYTCTNMTFDEAMTILHSGEPLIVLFMTKNDFGVWCYYATSTGLNQYSQIPCVLISDTKAGQDIYWYDDMISTSEKTPE